MMGHGRAVTPKELACAKNFSSKALAEGARLIDEAKQKFEENGFVPVETVKAIMEADGITRQFLLADSKKTLEEGLLVRAISSSQWFLIRGSNIHGEF
ncbi:hypothetical protein [Microcoleus sp. D3_18a_C4]|uniref:hypothetical protein n=1 Tax=Microcoleus sp. D3_18a_C4 TaxID=3055332 RepID=UPI002FD330A8